MAKVRPRGWWYPLIFVGGMLVVVVVNGVLIYFATSTFTGVETERHYEKGLAYNKTLAEGRTQAELGWRLDFAFAPAESGGGHGGELTVNYRDRDGRGLDDLTVAAEFVRPTTAGHDRQAALAPQGGGAYGMTVDLPLPGLWDVKLDARRGETRHREVHRIQVP